MATPAVALDLRLRKDVSLAARPFNLSSVSSILLAFLFLSYFIVPHDGILFPVLRLNLLFLLVVPLCALACSIIALIQISKTNERGVVISYVALGISSLYFVTALAVPVVIAGLYFLYAYVI